MNLSIPFFGKKKKQDRVVTSIAIVFNIVNHASLMAAMLVGCFLRERTDLEISMIDIRDNIPMNASFYIWLDAGEHDDFRSYMEGAAINNVQLRKWVMELKDRSLFLNSTKTQDRGVADTIIGQAYDFLEQSYTAGLDDRLLFSRYAVVSEEWLGNNIDAETASSYSEALQYSYYHYLGKELTLEILQSLLSPKEEKMAKYQADQKLFNRAMASRCRVRVIVGRTVQYLTATGPEVYAIVRRIALTRQEFMHVTEGSYGHVVYASISLPDAALETKQVFNLSAVNEPLKS